MKDLFCNQSALSYDVPRLIAEMLLGIEQVHRIEGRYQQMCNCYDFTYDEWCEAFAEDLKPFKEYKDTTSVTIPISHPQFSADIATLNKGAIGIDLPTWFNIHENNPHIMLIAQDPLRNKEWYEECHDAVVSSPFGLHDATHRNRGNGGKMVCLLVKELMNNGYGVYLTDAGKFFIYDHQTTDKFSASHRQVYRDILRKEMKLVKPALCVCLGRKSNDLLMGLENAKTLSLPHLSGTARHAIIKRFPILNEANATAENIAKEYANEIIKTIIP